MLRCGRINLLNTLSNSTNFFSKILDVSSMQLTICLSLQHHSKIYCVKLWKNKFTNYFSGFWIFIFLYLQRLKYTYRTFEIWGVLYTLFETWIHILKLHISWWLGKLNSFVDLDIPETKKFLQISYRNCTQFEILWDKRVHFIIRDSGLLEKALITRIPTKNKNNFVIFLMRAKNNDW